MPKTFKDVLAAELDAIFPSSGSAGQQDKDPFERARTRALLGLAFSGGGIRSATFNLGLIQGLAQLRLLGRFDYLSTVSGGSYIGSWLSAWVQRAGGIGNVEQALARTGGLMSGPEEPQPVKNLRERSNFLTPKIGLLSLDTLTGVATYLRNLLLNLVILVSLLAALLLLPRILAWLMESGMTLAPVHWLFARAPSLLTLFHFSTWLLFGMAIFFIGRNLALGDVSRRLDNLFYAKPRGIFFLIILPSLVGACLLSYWVPAVGLNGFGIGAAWYVGGLLTCLVFFFLEMTTTALEMRREPGEAKRSGSTRSFLWLVAGAIIAAVLAAALLYFYFRGMELVQEYGENTLLLVSGRALAIWHETAIGTPVILLVFSLAVVVHIGIVSRVFDEADREWWSRMGGWLIAIATGWLVVGATAVWGPLLVVLLKHWAAGLSLAWVVSTVAGVLAGRSAATGGASSKKWMELVARVGPYAFIAGLMIALSYGLHLLLVLLLPPAVACAPHDWLVSDFEWRYANHVCELSGTLHPALLWLFAALVALAVFLSYRVDINLFSFHMFYRNRLTRCYLGASRNNRELSAHPFTDFDPDDSPVLSDLAVRPYHIVNTALNITGGHHLAWQQRMAASFAFTRDHCGYELPDDPTPGYCETKDYVSSVKGWIHLSLPMTASGAAASPNWGYHTSPAIAFLLTVFNVRLGYWIQNSRYVDVWKEPGPRWGLNYLLKELAASASEESNFVYLSDGGHFENLGVYELVRRRCRFIVVSDAGQDGKYQFEDLGNMVRKCYIDLGIPIEIDVRAIMPQVEDAATPERCAADASCYSAHRCAVGTINYAAVDGKDAPPGYLLYIKPSLCGDEPVDIRHYKSTHPDFPHDTTLDQWFDEPQFESYRKLGYEICKSVFEPIETNWEHLDRAQIQGNFQELKQKWKSPDKAKT